MPKDREREILALASWWLAFRLLVMGGVLERGGYDPVRNMHDLGLALLGMGDYAAEMRLTCAEALRHGN